MTISRQALAEVSGEGVAGRTVALLGAGIMGTALGRRLLGLGCRLRVYNRTIAKTADLAAAGAVAYRSPIAAAEGADLVLTVLTDTAALRAVAFADDGFLHAYGSARRLIDCGTHEPANFARFAAEAAAGGWHVVEAPMTGSVHDASHGTLNFLAGGTPDDLAAVRSFLETLGRSVFHFGPAGSGNTAKLALNLLVGTMAFGLGEAIALLTARGLPVESFLQALAGSGLASPLYSRVGERYLQEDFTPRFPLAHLEKDLRWARDHALANGLQPVLASAICRVLADIDKDRKQRDYASLVDCLATGKF